MLEIPLTIVDLIVLGILGISGLIAWYRGFMKETLTVSAWLVAAVAAVFFWPAAKPFARSLVDPKWLADVFALVIEISIISPIVEEMGPSTGGITSTGNRTCCSFSVTSCRAR